MDRAQKQKRVETWQQDLGPAPVGKLAQPLRRRAAHVPARILDKHQRERCDLIGTGGASRGGLAYPEVWVAQQRSRRVRGE